MPSRTPIRSSSRDNKKLAPMLTARLTANSASSAGNAAPVGVRGRVGRRGRQRHGERRRPGFPAHQRRAYHARKNPRLHGELPRVRSSQQRFGLLLLALIATFFFEGIAGPGDVQRAFGTILVGITLLLALEAGEVRRPVMRVAIALIAAIVVATVFASFSSNSARVEGLTSIANALLIAAAPTSVVLGLLRNIRRTRTVTLTVVAGVLCLYLLLGLFFASMYVAIDRLTNHAFFAGGAPATPSNAVYFSFITMTTVGYGDFTAQTNLGHTLSAFEALIGQIYLVTVVAAIVSRLVPVRQADAPEPEDAIGG